MKNYKHHIKSSLGFINKGNSQVYVDSMKETQTYLTDNNIVYEQSGFFGSGSLRISFQNKSDMLLFLVLYGDKWEKTK